jgi:hypothetical protein
LALKKRFNWKVGIIFAILFVIILMIFYIFVVTKIDYNCKNTSSNSFSCKVYLAYDGIIKIYSNSIMFVFDKRCYGTFTPDDCIGPALSLMIITLFIIGFILGGILFRDRGLRKLI